MSVRKTIVQVAVPAPLRKVFDYHLMPAADLAPVTVTADQVGQVRGDVALEVDGQLRQHASRRTRASSLT